MTNLLTRSRALLSIPALAEPHRSVAVSIEEPSEEYVRLSQRLGINKIPLRLVELAKVVREETLGIYPYEEVARYLDKQIEKLVNSRPDRWHSYHEWRWHPVKSTRLGTTHPAPTSRPASTASRSHWRFCRLLPGSWTGCPMPNST